MNEPSTRLVIIAGLSLVALIILACWFYAKKRKRESAGGLSPSEYRRLFGKSPDTTAAKSINDSAEIAQLRQNLLVKFLHERQKVEAAIEYERERNANGTEKDWIKAAIYRWERENS